MLCRFSGIETSAADYYKDAIIGLLMQNVSKRDTLEHITALGYCGKRTAFEVYCRKLINELGISYMPRRNAAGIHIPSEQKQPTQHYVSKAKLERYLWSGNELASSDITFIFSKYPQVLEIQRCIQDFRRIYDFRDITLLESFINYYAASSIVPIKSFASGLCSDLDAVANSITSELSNGFVEGINNKIKAIKRVMYGRAKIDLLKVKVLYAR